MRNRQAALALMVTVFCLGAIAQMQASDAEFRAACRLSDPMDCSVSEHPDAQAMFYQRCAEDRQRCTFRPNGTVLRWVGRGSWERTPVRNPYDGKTYALAIGYFPRAADPSMSNYLLRAAEALQRRGVQ